MNKRLLLCDDEPAIVRAAEFKLSRAGFDVVLASDGEEAWHLVQQSTPDLLVTDYQMPRLDGLSLLRRLRSDERFADLPAILLTAKGMELDARSLIEQMRLSALISKPFSPRELLALVESVIGSATGVAAR